MCDNLHRLLLFFWGTFFGGRCENTEHLDFFLSQMVDHAALVSNLLDAINRISVCKCQLKLTFSIGNAKAAAMQKKMLYSVDLT